MSGAKDLAIVSEQARLPARRAPAPLNRFAFEPENLAGAIQIAELMCKSGLLPAEVRSPQAALAIITFGREFGFTVWQSFRFIQVIKGKPGLNAQGMAAVILASGKAKYFRCSEVTATEATWETERADDPGRLRAFTYTMAEAAKAGLTQSQMYSKYPRQMLRWRACTELARQEYSDVVGGIYTPDDFGEIVGTEEPESAGPIIEVPPTEPGEVPFVAADPPPASKTEAIKAQLKKSKDPQAEAAKAELADLKASLTEIVGEDQAGWLWAREVQTTTRLRDRVAKAHEIISRVLEATVPPNGSPPPDGDDGYASEPGSNG